MPRTPDDLNGLVRLRRELVAEGLTDNAIAHLTTQGVLVRVRRGAYVHGEAWHDLSPEDRHRVLARAVLRTAHPRTVLTHTSSLVERGIPLWGVDLSTVHTTRVEQERAGRTVSDWTPHRATLGPDDTELVNGVRISSAARSAVEITTILGVEPSLVAVNGLLRVGAMTHQELREAVDTCRFWPRTLTANLVVHLADERLESVGEDRFSYFVHRHGLPTPEPQVAVHDESHHVFARLDFAWRERGVWIEFDGRTKYERHRRAGESLEEFVMREKRREERIAHLTGWTCLRVTWADLANPELLASRIRNILSSRGTA